VKREEIRKELEAIWNDPKCRHPGHKSCWNIEEEIEGALGYWLEPNYILVNSRGKKYPPVKGNRFRLPPRYYPSRFWMWYGMQHRGRYSERYRGVEVQNRADNAA